MKNKKIIITFLFLFSLTLFFLPLHAENFFGNGQSDPNDNRCLNDNPYLPLAFESHLDTFGNPPSTDVIILFLSHNQAVLKKQEVLLEQLKKQDYSGHILYFRGGEPDIESGQILLCRKPYRHKFFAFMEAQKLGYKRALWLDSNLMPTQELFSLFDYISQNGFLIALLPSFSDNFHKISSCGLYPPSVEIDSIENTSLPPESFFLPASNITFDTRIIGLNLDIEKVHHLLSCWHPENHVEQNPLIHMLHEEEVPLTLLLNQTGHLDLLQKDHAFFSSLINRRSSLESERIGDSYFKLYDAHKQQE